MKEPFQALVGASQVFEHPEEFNRSVTWQENLLKLGRQAENNIYAWVDKDESIKSVSFEKFTMSNVLTTKACRQMQDAPRLPLNTPAEELQFFNS